MLWEHTVLGCQHLKEQTFLGPMAILLRWREGRHSESVGLASSQYRHVLLFAKYLFVSQSCGMLTYYMLNGLLRAGGRKWSSHREVHIFCMDFSL